MATIKNAGNSLTDYMNQMEHRLADRSKREYVKRLKELFKSIQQDEGSGSTPVTPTLVIEKFATHAQQRNFSAASFRLYKSSLMYWLGREAQSALDRGGHPMEFAVAFDTLRELKHDAATRSPPRTAAKKLKLFPLECVYALKAYASKHGERASLAIRTVEFVEANLLVGLRPSEWFDTAFCSRLLVDANGHYLRDSTGRIKFEYMMIVGNAKTTHGRGNGQYRELVFHNITEEELTALWHFRTVVVEFMERFPANTDVQKINTLFFQPMNKLIARVLSAAGFPVFPSTYSTRHQVVADFKASGISKEEIAAFFGHSSDLTNSKHYGHRKHGSRAVTFRPSPESLSRVGNSGRSLQRKAIKRQQATSEVKNWLASKPNV